MVKTAQDPSNPTTDAADRLLVDTQHASFRFERERRDASGTDRGQKIVSDGITEWRSNYRGAFHARQLDPDAFPARNLLDPPWLAAYDWDTPLMGEQNDRDVYEVHAWQVAGPVPDAAPPAGADGGVSTVLRRPPAEVDVLVDARHGFLHRMTGFVESKPLVVEELLDVMLDPPLDEATFRIDKARSEVIELPEWGPDNT